MDIPMPVKDGYEATRAIRAREAEHNLRRTPIFALTASALDRAMAMAREAGCDEHIAKPAQKAALFDLLRRRVSPKPPGTRPEAKLPQSPECRPASGNTSRPGESLGRR